MRCQRCQFENIPGETRCLRCGSILEAKDVAVDVHPPRMAHWKGPERAALRWLRLHIALPKVRVPAFMKIMSAEAFLGLILSVIPGLAHYVGGRLREVRWFLPGWFLALLAGIFFYGSGLGFLLLGLAVGLHGWIAFSYALSKERTETSGKIRDFAVLLVVFAFLYWGVRAIAFGDFVFGLSNLAVPGQNVEVGDVLLARRSRAQGGNFPRGSLVFGRFPQIYNNQVVPDRYTVSGQIVAFPGEKVEINGGRFVVNDLVLARDKFPVPRWLSEERLSATIPAGCYFVSTTYRRAGANLRGDMVRDVCILRKGDIEALAVMRWFPLAKRGLLRADQ